MKLMTFAVPCYNSAAYMNKCVDSLLKAKADIEIIIIDDGSKDDTARIADAYQERYPGIVKAIHQENGGHGEGVNVGLKNASGLYYKVVDSDDWMDEDNMNVLLTTLETLLEEGNAPDLMITNFMALNTVTKKNKLMHYKALMPIGRLFHWNEMKKFRFDKKLLMHSLYYKTDMLRKYLPPLPKHTFYVDTLFSALPLCNMEKLYYLDIDVYRYFLGRPDQSVYMANMIKYASHMYRVYEEYLAFIQQPHEWPSPQLKKYVYDTLAAVMTLISAYALMASTEESLAMRSKLWADLKQSDPVLYKRLKGTFSNFMLTKDNAVFNALSKIGIKIVMRAVNFNF